MIDNAEGAVTDKTLRRIVVTSGFAGALAFAVGGAWLQVAGLDAFDAGGGAIHKGVSEHRTSLLACYVLWNVAIMIQLVFSVTLSLLTFRSGHLFAAILGGLSATVLTALMFIGFVFLGSLAFRAPHLSPETSLLLSDLFYLVLSVAGFPAAVVLAALSMPLFRARGLSRFISLLGIASAAVHVEAAVALSRSGTWSPAGWGGYVGPTLLVAWMMGVSFLFLRSDVVTPSQP